MDALIGMTVFWVVSGLALLAFVAIPALRAAAMLATTIRTGMRHIEGWVRARPLGAGPERPLELAGLPPRLAALVCQTRIVTVELRRYAEQSVIWPEPSPVARQTWWCALQEVPGYESHTAATREAWEWVRAVERLPATEREQLVNLGIDPEPVRALLRTTDLSVAAQIRALAGLIDSFDERITALGHSGYRGTSTGAPHAAPPSIRGATQAEDDTDDAVLRERRRRWTELLHAHGIDITRIAGAHASTRAEREDLEQEIALALWQALPTFRGESSLRTFVRRIARYCHYRIVRRSGRARIEPYVDAIDDASPCAESWLSRAEQREQLERAIERLPDGSRGALALRLAGKTYAEIAQILGISEQNVSVRLVRARQRIVDELCRPPALRAS